MLLPPSCHLLFLFSGKVPIGVQSEPFLSLLINQSLAEVWRNPTLVEVDVFLTANQHVMAVNAFAYEKD